LAQREASAEPHVDDLVRRHAARGVEQDEEGPRGEPPRGAGRARVAATLIASNWRPAYHTPAFFIGTTRRPARGRWSPLREATGTTPRAPRGPRTRARRRPASRCCSGACSATAPTS